MALKVDITNAMKGAMRARQKDRLKTIRLILSEIKRVEVDERIDIDDFVIREIVDQESSLKTEKTVKTEKSEKTVKTENCEAYIE